jgi:O-acetylserine/cysteine efflux transporter
MTASRSPLGPLDCSVAIAMVVAWGFNIIAMKIIVGEAGALPSAMLRQLMVFAICLPFLRIVPGRMLALTGFGLLSGAAFYLAVSWSLAVADNVGALAIAGQLGVPFSLILAVLILKERIHWRRIAGILLALAGVVLLLFDPEAGKEIHGILVTALASLIWAFGALIQRGLKGVPVLTITAWVGAMGSLVMIPVTLIGDPAGFAAIADLPLSAFGWVAYAAIVSSIMGHGAMAWLLQRHDVSVIVPFTIPTPVISVAAAAWWFGTPVTPLMMLGGLIAIAGVAIVALRTAHVEGPVPETTKASNVPD